MDTLRQRAEFWGRLKPPTRPSAGDLAQYEATLRAEPERGHPASCLILGSTPELRSLAHRRGYRVVCADSDGLMFEALTSMVQPGGPEEFLHTDWLEISGDRRYDIVLGDGAVNMVPIERLGEFLGAMARVTEPGGAAVLRVHLQTDPPFASIEEIVAWYRRDHRGKPFFPAIRTPLYMLLMRQKATQVIDTGEIHTYLASLRDKGILTDEEFSSHRHFSILVNFTRAEVFERLASRWFAIERIRHGADYGFPENHPIYVLRRT